MAFVGKWIGLGASQGAGSQNSTEDTQEEGPSKPQTIAKAEFKRFGLENVSASGIYPLRSALTCLPPGFRRLVWEYLVRVHLLI